MSHRCLAMSSLTWGLFALAFCLHFANNVSANDSGPVVTRVMLDNGLPVTYARVSGFHTFVAVSYFPRGLLADEPNHAFWTQLVERMTTQPQGYSDGSTNEHCHNFRT